jgi:hypothetical protein
MQTPLQKKINYTLLSNRFFKKLDKVVRFDGKDIFEQWGQYHMKNLGKVIVPRYSDEILKICNRIYENNNSPKRERTYIELKRVEIRNTHSTAPFDYIYIQIPLIPEWWIDKNKSIHDFFECKLFYNGKLTRDFITLHLLDGAILISPEYLDRQFLHFYLDDCLNAFLNK